jgi:hypothetical protein
LLGAFSDLRSEIHSHCVVFDDLISGILVNNQGNTPSHAGQACVHGHFRVIADCNTARIARIPTFDTHERQYSHVSPFPASGRTPATELPPFLQRGGNYCSGHYADHQKGQ